MIRDNVYIEDNTFVPEGTVIAPFSHIRGSPCMFSLSERELDRYFCEGTSRCISY